MGGLGPKVLTAGGALLLVALVLWQLTSLRLISDASRDLLRVGATAVIYSALALLLLGGYDYVASQHEFHERVRQEKANRVGDAIDELQRSRKLELDTLFRLNRAQLDEYHVMSVRQQNLAFRNAQVAAAIGFLTLLVGVAISYNERVGEGRFLTLGLTALASLLSGYIAKVFFRSAELTGEHLREFYKEPRRTGEMLAIERLAALPRDDDQMDGHETGTGVEELRRIVVEGLIHQLAPDPEDREGPRGASAQGQGASHA